MDLIFYIILALAFITFTITCLFTNLWLGVCSPRKIFKFPRGSSYNPSPDHHRQYRKIQGDFKESDCKNCVKNCARFSNNFCQECRVEIPDQVATYRNFEQNTDCPCQEQQQENIKSVQDNSGEQGTIVKKKQNNYSSFVVVQ